MLMLRDMTADDLLLYKLSAGTKTPVFSPENPLTALDSLAQQNCKLLQLN